MRFKWAVRKPFRILPAWVWLITIDATDFVSWLVDAVASFLGVGVGGLTTNTIFDAIQSLMVFAIFEEPILLFVNADYLLPQGLDILPSYTSLYVADQVGLLG